MMPSGDIKQTSEQAKLRVREPFKGEYMKTSLIAVVAGAAFVAFTGMAVAHHSFAMFDQEHPMEVTGVVKEYKYTSPHSFIILNIKDKDGKEEAWNLEGGSPSALARDGWTSKSLKPGDELRLTIEPLRSGAPGRRLECQQDQVQRRQADRRKEDSVRSVRGDPRLLLFLVGAMDH